MAWTLKPLPPRMADFVTAFLKTRDVTKACREIGAKKPNGFRMMRDPRVMACIELGLVPPEALDPVQTKAAEKKANIARAAATGSAANQAKRAAAREELGELRETVASYAAIAPGEILDAEGIKRRLSLIADANAVELFEMKRVGKTLKLRLKPLHEISPALACAIARIELMSSGTVKIHLTSKLEAMRLLGQANGMFRQGEDDVPVPGAVTDEALSYEKRLERYGNVLKPSFGPKPVKPD